MFCLPCVEATALLDQQNNNTDSKWYLLVKSKSDKRNITVLFGQHKPQTHCLLLAALLHLYFDSLFGIYREDIGGSKWLPKFSAFRDVVGVASFCMLPSLLYHQVQQLRSSFQN